MINRKFIDENTIQFEDFAVSSASNKIGDHVEVSMGGPYTAKRFVISRRERIQGDGAKILLTAKAVVSVCLNVLDPVAGTITRCGEIVGHYTEDEICGLHYVTMGKDFDPNAPYFCADSALEVLKLATT